MLTLPPYVLITPARNEAQFIELTIKSVVAQAVRPVKWVIVSDGSTDGTDDIVSRYAVEHPWIELVRMPVHRERHFAAKVYAFNAGYARVKDLRYEIIGNLDADISFDDEAYFAFLLRKFAENCRLGVGGTPYMQGNSTYDYRFVNIEDVSGACQLFRRECFEEIGGYIPMKGGGVDHIAFLTARMKGWKTRTFTDKVCLHHRQAGRAQHGPLMASFRTGALDYALGGHPIWEMFRTIYQMTKRPLVVGGFMLGAGYIWALVRRVQRPISHEMVAFRRHEQLQRLRKFITLKADTGFSGVQACTDSSAASDNNRLREADAVLAPPDILSAPSGTKSWVSSNSAAESARGRGAAAHSGLLIINADDWGRDRETTERIFECVLRGAVSSVSAMVFMEDSERAAAIARERGIDAGLHLNFTTPFSATKCPPQLIERQHELARCLLRHRLSPVLFYPALMRSFKYVVTAQHDEFCRLYGTAPARLDGHHHVQLCSNVVLGGLLPPGTMVRRNFSFAPGEKSLSNRLYRKVVDGMLARRHRLTDFFFSLPPFEPRSHLQRIFALAHQFVVEVETHPVNPEEYRFLAGGEIFRWTDDSPVEPCYHVRPNGRTRR